MRRVLRTTVIVLALAPFTVVVGGAGATMCIAPELTVVGRSDEVVGGSIDGGRVAPGQVVRLRAEGFGQCTDLIHVRCRQSCGRCKPVADPPPDPSQRVTLMVDKGKGAPMLAATFTSDQGGPFEFNFTIPRELKGGRIEVFAGASRRIGFKVVKR